MSLLHKSGYDVTRAKFSMMFPYYVSYNRLRPETAINLCQEEMETHMRKYRERVRRTREKDEERWVEEITQKIDAKVDLHHLATLIETGKQNKFEIP